MPLQIIRNDITRVAADAIVNTANPEPIVGGGTDSAIYEAAGREQLLEARKKIGAIAPGQAFHTPAFALKAKYVIHTVGPAWIDGAHGEREVLASCYASSLALAEKLGCRSVAFPLISSGVYGFPDGEALTVALTAIQRFLVDTDEDMQVTLVVFGKNTTVLSSKIREGVREYISEAEVHALREKEYGFGASEREQRALRRRRMQNLSPALREETADLGFLAAPTAAPAGGKAGAAKAAGPVPTAKTAGGKLEDYLPKGEDSFTARLLRLVNASGKSNKEIYNAANLSKKVFSSIFSKKNYHPSKNTVLALCVALRLDTREAGDLLARAGYAFSPADTTDCVVRWFLDNGEFNVFEVNYVLCDLSQPVLGLGWDEPA